ncbi:SprT family zinc-dependent metalloprotease [Cellulophaga lytica]|nr:SprT family zinc-dependent metalloprotease [Cellulophaga lytica]
MTTHRYKDIEYALKKSNRKTSSIYIERDGSISVLVPKQLSHPEIEDILEKKRYKIYSHLAEWEDVNTSRVYREFVSGEGFYYLGRTYKLEIVDDQDTPLKLKNGHFLLRKKDLSKAKEHFVNFYKTKGKSKIQERVAYWKQRLNVEPNEMRIMELQNRWGSCTEKGNINFHWKSIMTPISIIDYIIAHELTHLIHPNHSEAFWFELDKVMPDYHQRKSWLKVHGAGMDL